jgi:hypothetical protein
MSCQSKPHLGFSAVVASGVMEVTFSGLMGHVQMQWEKLRPLCRKKPRQRWKKSREKTLGGTIV